MASCFHDEQDIESDLKIEVARENDILEVGQELKDKYCEKNQGHQGFIPFKDLTLQDLPTEDRDLEMLDMIKRSGNCIVRLVVGKKLGTGSVIKLNNEYYITTNSHVVKCDEDVKNCHVEFNYNSNDDMSNISISEGVKLDFTCPDRDFTMFTFDPVPEFIKQLNLLDYGDMYPTIFIIYKNNQIVKEKTYCQYQPSQHISYTGKDINDEQIDMMFLVWPDKSFSYMKSCYFRFLPIPSNIENLTKIKEHVDEDDVNGRMISGDVVKLGGEYVIKISESISQDEVKKYKIVCNGDEISRGTRLYFEYFKSREFFSHLKGVDFEDKMKEYPTNVWFFDFHPKPRQLVKYLEELNNDKRTDKMCCIGHPHGGIKMVTFGIDLGTSTERFNKQGRHIVQPGKDCQCKEVTCLKYSCKTCPGSSGSVIFSLHKIAGADDPVHFMGARVEGCLPNGELIENINMAWLR